MTARTKTQSKSVDGKSSHVPVLLQEVLQYMNPNSDEVIIDGTFGAGGYSSAFLAKGAEVIGIDRDPYAIANGRILEKANPKKLKLYEGRFSELDKFARRSGHELVDGIVLDLGVSSMQLDEAERGFSFRKDGPLDMRMERTGPSAQDIVNKMSVKDLVRIIGVLGEEKRANAIARAIDRVRKKKCITRTIELATLVENVLGRDRKSKIHPATRTFQGLRIFVNGELNEIALALQSAETVLRKNGRLVVVSFHSLEDRIVKKFFVNRSKTHSGGSRHMPETEVLPPSFTMMFKGAIVPSESEVTSNPRARSSRMRMGLRTENPAHEPDTDVLGVPHMPKYRELGRG